MLGDRATLDDRVRTGLPQYAKSPGSRGQCTLPCTRCHAPNSSFSLVHCMDCLEAVDGNLTGCNSGALLRLRVDRGSREGPDPCPLSRVLESSPAPSFRARVTCVVLYLQGAVGSCKALDKGSRPVSFSPTEVALRACTPNRSCSCQF